MDKAYLSTKIDTLIEYGHTQITSKKQLEKFPIGALISYLNINNTFRPGGFLVDFFDDHFIYVTPDFETLRKGKYARIIKMWVASVYDTQNDLVSIFPTQNKKTNFSVIINGIPIYFARNSFDMKRFMNTNKYKLIMKWVDFFEHPSDNSSSTDDN